MGGTIESFFLHWMNCILFVSSMPLEMKRSLYFCSFPDQGSGAKILANCVLVRKALVYSEVQSHRIFDFLA